MRREQQSVMGWKRQSMFFSYAEFQINYAYMGDMQKAGREIYTYSTTYIHENTIEKEIKLS